MNKSSDEIKEEAKQAILKVLSKERLFINIAGGFILAALVIMVTQAMEGKTIMWIGAALTGGLIINKILDLRDNLNIADRARRGEFTDNIDL